MADVTVLPTGGTSGGGGTNWLLVGGAGLGVLVVLYLLTKSSGGASAGQPTTAAGTSINAALGSIQEQNLNIMGEIGQNEQALSGQLADVGNNVILGNAGIGDLQNVQQNVLLPTLENGIGYLAANQAAYGTNLANGIGYLAANQAAYGKNAADQMQFNTNTLLAALGH